MKSRSIQAPRFWVWRKEVENPVLFTCSFFIDLIVVDLLVDYFFIMYVEFFMNSISLYLTTPQIVFNLKRALTPFYTDEGINAMGSSGAIGKLLYFCCCLNE